MPRKKATKKIFKTDNIMTTSKEFYPTPNNIIEKMVQPYITTWKNDQFIELKGLILEPSAGKGAICDYIANFGYKRHKINCKFHVVEIEPDFQSILIDKKYTLVHDNFLSYEPDYLYNYIFMNPPFSNGIDHLLHAWEILKHGDIVCLLNAETINNPYTKKRENLLQLIEKFGSTENLGNCFADSERHTDVEVVLIRLTKEKDPNVLDLNFKLDKEEQPQLNEKVTSSEITLLDVLGAKVEQYHTAKDNFINLMQAYKKLAVYSQGLVRSGDSFRDTCIKTLQAYGSEEDKYNTFIDDLKLDSWVNTLSYLKLDRLLTTKVKKNFNEYLNQQGRLAFTKDNVKKIVLTLIDNIPHIMQTAIEDVFRALTDHYKDNRMNVEGWKTNSGYKINRKVIVPTIVTSDFSNTTYRASWGYHGDMIKDLDKTLCYLNGDVYEEIKTVNEAIGEVAYGDSSLHFSTYFSFRCYQKGTIHLTFKDEYLWNKFNLTACKGEKGVPYKE